MTSGAELRAMVLAGRRAAVEAWAEDYEMRVGSRKWQDYVERHERLGAAQSLALDQAAAIADRIVELEALVKAGGLVVTGSTGQPKAHPALAELRADRAELRDLVAKLALKSR